MRTLSYYTPPVKVCFGLGVRFETVFHYAQCLFEGLKAYRDASGRVTMFRPDMNMKRMNRSAQRIALPVRISRTLFHS